MRQALKSALVCVLLGCCQQATAWSARAASGPGGGGAQLVASASSSASGPGQSASSAATNDNGRGSGAVDARGGASASALAAGAAHGCRVAAEATNAGGCGFATRVVSCPNAGTVAQARTADGDVATCCVVLTKLPEGRPALVCAAPAGAGGQHLPMPPGVAVELQPACDRGSGKASLTCSVAFNAPLPAGFAVPAQAVVLASGQPHAGFRPCNNAKFSRFSQVTAGGQVVAKCE